MGEGGVPGLRQVCGEGAPWSGGFETLYETT